MSAMCVEYSRRNGMCPGAGLSCSRVTSPAVQWSMHKETYLVGPGYLIMKIPGERVVRLPGLWGPHQLDPSS